MKNQYPTFPMDAVRGADLTQRHNAGLDGLQLCNVCHLVWVPCTRSVFQDGTDQADIRFLLIVSLPQPDEFRDLNFGC